MLKLTLAFIAALALSAGISEAQTCEGTSGNGRCNATNTLSGLMPTTNADATPFNDFASVEVVYAPTANACSQTVGAVTKNLGPLDIPVTPLPSTTVSTKLGPLGLPNGKVFVAMRVVDLVGNRSDCSNEVSFINDDLAPSPPTNVSVGPSNVSVGP